MKYVSDIMFWISNGLLIPVVVGLIFLFAKSLLILGSLFAAYQARRSSEQKLGPLFSQLESHNLGSLEGYLEGVKNPSLFLRYTSMLLSADRPRREYLIGEYELQAQKRMSSISLVAKFGPTLGLMGTLIPMGPALVGLASGDIASMAYNMQVAFATTVIGLFAGAVGYAAKRPVTAQMQRDMNRLLLVSDLMENHN
ncbi:MotA/TolQ/ExbB proton channel family protein [Porphyromonas crevioricanis]|uniref:MotA/TolQ/ExbB proton channel domain-containing protein n=1 Tax=Porphyromonas crevioricanis TaxID=393921 RepID=A0AB34PGJ8_9PORP|nr:MotA/TolQ/ExbB proton channel family protein [Porphyromonas crevioricanis]KGN95027.1 hypothetical protein HQ38_04345 [Porphyromonas crevioricanis]